MPRVCVLSCQQCCAVSCALRCVDSGSSKAEQFRSGPVEQSTGKGSGFKQQPSVKLLPLASSICVRDLGTGQGGSRGCLLNLASWARTRAQCNSSRLFLSLDWLVFELAVLTLSSRA